MFDLMQNILLIFIEAICCKIFFETFGKIRHKHRCTRGTNEIK